MRPTINQLRTLTDFCPSYRWDMAATLPAVVAQALGGGTTAITALNLRTTSISIPKRSVDPIEVSNRGHRIYREGMTSFSQQIALSTIGTIDAVTHQAINYWHNMQWSVEGTGTSAEVYGRMSSNNPLDRQATITLTALNNTDTGYWQYLIIGCWLQDAEFGEFGSDSSDILRPGMTMTYDYFVDGPVTEV